MTTRTIVTSQPDVACYVCERRLLRGEQPEMFLAAGRSRTVCELCAPRAAHEGWPREADSDSVSMPPLRTRRGRNLFERLRQVGRPADAPECADTGSAYDREPEPYDFLSGPAATEAPPVRASLEDRTAAAPPSAPAEPWDTGAIDGDRHTIPTAEAGGRLERAIAVFNAGESPRRIASLARSLDTPDVSVRADEDLAGVVAIVVAWELCWYHYRVDLDEETPEARVIAQGTELDELARADRLANAAADELGTLSLTGAHT